MTLDEKIDIKNFFEGLKLPGTIKTTEGIISNPALYVATALKRMDEGVIIIQQTSYNALVKLKEVLGKKN